MTSFHKVDSFADCTYNNSAVSAHLTQSVTKIRVKYFLIIIVSYLVQVRAAAFNSPDISPPDHRSDIAHQLSCLHSIQSLLLCEVL